MRGLTHRPGLLETFVAAAMLAAGCGKDPSGKPTAPPPDLKALVAQADAMAARGLNVEAALHLKPWLESFPQSERGAAQLRVARFYHGGNVHDLSLKYAEAAIAAGTVDPEALYITGDAQRTLFKAEARATLERLLALEPGHCLGRLSLARLLFRAADPASSLPLFESYFEAAAPDDPHQPVAVLEHARALRAAGRCQEAADRFAMLLEQDPLDAKLYSELASALYRLKLRKEARFVEEIYKLVSQSSFDEHVEARLRETGATAFALGQQAANRTRQRRYLEAFTAYRRAIEVDPVDPRLRIYLADLCIQFRRFP
ncbi:MAG: tetratricopeptide repeat protein, partial [Planctomycetes bacterium]|nr:tetratricopeptide repeat protein [Planctomycetota bacterium]